MGIPLKAHWFRFTDAGRHFAEAYGLLDSLRFDPSVKPDWPSSG